MRALLAQSARQAPAFLAPHAGLLAAAIGATDAALRHRYPLFLASAFFAVVAWRRGPRLLALLATIGVGVQVLANGHALVNWRASAAPGEAHLRERMAEVEARKAAWVGRVVRLAEQAAALKETREVMAADRSAPPRLFRALDSLRASDPSGPAVAVHSLPLSLLAWSGGPPDSAALEGVVPRQPVFVLEGSVTTTLVAAVPVRAPGGKLLGVATASLPLAVKRNIRNALLQDFDLLAGNDRGTEVRYIDVRAALEPAEPFPPLDPALVALELPLRAPNGLPIAQVRVTSWGAAPSREETLAPYRVLMAGVSSAIVLAWAFRAGLLARVLSVLALRAALLLLGPPFPASLRVPEAYAHPAWGPLLRSPADLLASALCLTLVVTWGVSYVLSFVRRTPSLAIFPVLAGWLSVGLWALVFRAAQDAVGRSALDVETIRLVPQSPAHLAIHLALLLVAAVAALLTLLLHALPGPWPVARSRRALWAALWFGGALVGVKAWGLTLVAAAPALGLTTLAAVLGADLASWRERLLRLSPELRAGLLVLAAAALALAVAPSLFSAAEADLGRRVETSYAPVALRQSDWREQVLASSLRRLDTMNVLEDPPAGGRSQGLEELAFALWSVTDLAGFGFSSAVEVQDPSGAVISRFALNLPSLEPPARSLPAEMRWKTSTETTSLASAQRTVLHARRRLTYHGATHGAVHVLVGDDFWNLPFLRSKDPYSVLFRPSGRGPARARGLVMLVYDTKTREPLFSSAARAPAIQPDLVTSRLASPLPDGRSGSPGFWSVLPVEGAAHRVFFFGDKARIYALGYAQVSAGRYVADLVEAVVGLTLAVVAFLLGILVARSLIGYRSFSFSSLLRAVRRRFATRLFVAMVALAVGPVIVLEVVVRGFVADRLQREFENLALERASFARKLVEDYAFFQRREGAALIGDEPLVWIAGLIHNDLSIFDKGRLLASSKRELFASGLLAPRASGTAYRALLLEDQPSVLEVETVGELSYLVASVPVKLGGADKGILTMPLALRQREVGSAIEDLDRVIRLASVAFLGLAGVIAHSMARRISGPIRDLTAASHRIAEGDLETRVTPRTRDELQGLVEAFNQMAGDLDRQRRDLERSNRLAAWAEMARQVAHEVKNPLTPIQLSTEHLRRVYGDATVDFGATLTTCTDTILRQVRTLRGIVHEFSAFARPPDTDLVLLDPARLVEETVAPYRVALPPGVRMTVDRADELPPVRGDRRLLERALTNLIENALHAVGDEGRISIRLASSESQVEITVEDSGPGVDPEILDRIFEPFFSTKSTGSGLGLALVRKIAEDHGGGVRLESEASRATRAVLWLPTGR